MPRHWLTAYSLFINLHRSLLMRAFAIDMAFVALGVGYMLFPSTEFTYSIPNGIFLFMTVLIFVAIQVRLLRSHAGGIAFYRQLPVTGVPYLLAGKLATVAPFLIALVLVFSMIALAGSLFPNLHIPSPGTLAVRAFQVTVVFIAMKSYVTPTMLLSKKHPLFLGLFYGLIIVMILFGMALHEFFFCHLRFAQAWDLAALLILLTCAELWVIRNAK